MKTPFPRSSFDMNDPPHLDEARRAELSVLKSDTCEPIDFSDIPPLEEKFWRNAVRNPYVKPIKRSTTVRIDADVLAWLRSHGRGYQTRINAILRREMLASRKG